MKKAVSIGLIAVVLVISAFAVSTLLSPHPSSGLDGFGSQLEIKEIVWDGGILNGEYLVTITNPIDRIIEASIYVYAQDMEEKWQFLKCGKESFNEEDNTALITVFYPNSETELHTEKKEYLFSESLKIIAVSGDSYLLERTVSVTKFVRFEFISVEWGEMVNRSNEPETARYLNFTLFNNGEDTSFYPFFDNFWLSAYSDSWQNVDSRSHGVTQGLTSILMMGDVRYSDYKLYHNDKLLWEGTIT